MNLEEIFELGAFPDIKKELTKNTPENEISDYIKQYDGEHQILNRTDKIVKGEKVTVAKLVVKLQKIITEMRVAFVMGKGRININAEGAKDRKGVDLIKELWKKIKLDKHTRNLIRRLYVETRAAELFYIMKRKGKDGKEVLTIRVKLLCEENGDTIYPYWDEYGDLIAFTREYTVADGKRDVPHVDIYTAGKIIYAHKPETGDWEVFEKENLIGKIPVIYYEQDEPEWTDVQSLIERMEVLLSNHADTNDYIGNPAVKIKGKIKNMPKKEENVKVFQFESETIDGKQTYGDAEYMVYTGMPESLKMEYQNLKELIYSLTGTPDLSFNNVKGTGIQSGIAFKFMFMQPIMIADVKREDLIEGLERRINLLRTMVSKATDIKAKGLLENLDFYITFDDVLPENVAETMDVLIKATGQQPVLSRKTAIALNPLVENPDEELKQVEREQEETVPKQESFDFPIPVNTGVTQQVEGNGA